MAGIYIHIPFCKQACHYCDFHFSTSFKTYDGVVSGIRKELRSRSEELKGQTVDTLYFGGGTPSLLTERDLREIMEDITRNFSLSGDAEITLEANPDDLQPSHFSLWRNVGINRLSLGIQSFHDEDLKWMNRAHDSREANVAVDRAREAGFENLTIDLIYGIPISSEARWMDNVEKALKLRVPHISAYALTVEKRTALASFIEKGKAQAPSEERSESDFRILRKALIDAGFHHYEISNYALPGKESRHNSAYWSGVPYLGIGPGAHSFLGSQRRWNVSNNSIYVRSMEKGEVYWDQEELSVVDRFNEWVMTGLRRLTHGIDLGDLQERFGAERMEQLLRDASNHLERGDLVIKNNRMMLSERSIFRADGIASDLFQLA